MWDDVIIGEGRKTYSATRVFSIEGEHDISENKVSFWISHLYLDLGMTIFKDTTEGKLLTDMINNKNSLETITEFLIDILLLNISKDKLKVAIDLEIQRSFNEGRRSKTREIREVLGFRG
jgi:hypothetical protein